MGIDRLMEFETKTALIEHIKELVNDEYLNEHWEIQQHEAGTSGFKYYTINFDAVKKDDWEGDPNLRVDRGKNYSDDNCTCRAETIDKECPRHGSNNETTN